MKNGQLIWQIKAVGYTANLLYYLEGTNESRDLLSYIPEPLYPLCRRYS